VELATARSLRDIGDLPPGLDGLAAAALVLAQALDDGAGLATAAVARELRATLTKLAEGVRDDGDVDPFAEFTAGLGVPAEVGDSGW
jgi:hypothetical protein